MKNKLFFQIDPALLELQIKTNVHPYVYMTKYALLHFLNFKDTTDHKFAMTYTSSMAAFVRIPNFAEYGGTKNHNYMLGKLLNQTMKKNQATKDLVDIQTLHPAGVSTNLNKFTKLGGEIVSAESCARGSLSDLGNNTMHVFGALTHAALGNLLIPLAAWSPDFNKIKGFEMSKDANSVIQD